MPNRIPRNIPPDSEGENHAELEKCFIDEYLKHKGYTIESLNKLPEDEVQRIMSEASTYASGKLAEIESRAGYTQKLKGVGHQ